MLLEDMDPITYPTIKLDDGNTYELKFRAYDLMSLKKQGVDLFAASQALTGIEGVERTIQLLTAAIAWKHPGLTVDDVAKIVTLDLISPVSEAITAALLKVRTQATASTVPVQ